MTNRASVMKSFAQCLQHECQVLLQTDEGLAFLHCNAHFLLSLSSEVKKVLLKEEEARRENQAGYRRASECLAYRYCNLKTEVY